MRKASGDPDFVLPYWSYDDPQQGSLPTAFLPDADEIAAPPKEAVPAPRGAIRSRAPRGLLHVDRRWIGLGDAARDCQTALALDRFTATDKLDALQGLRRRARGRSGRRPGRRRHGGRAPQPRSQDHRARRRHGLAEDRGARPDLLAAPRQCRPAVGEMDRSGARPHPAGRRRRLDDDQIPLRGRGRDRSRADRRRSARYPVPARLSLRRRSAARGISRSMPPGRSACRAGVAPAQAGLRGRAVEPVVLARSAAMRLLARESNVALASTHRRDGRRRLARRRSGRRPGGCASCSRTWSRASTRRLTTCSWRWKEVRRLRPDRLRYASAGSICSAAKAVGTHMAGRGRPRADRIRRERRGRAARSCARLRHAAAARIDRAARLSEHCGWRIRAERSRSAADWRDRADAIVMYAGVRRRFYCLSLIGRLPSPPAPS